MNSRASLRRYRRANHADTKTPVAIWLNTLEVTRRCAAFGIFDRRPEEWWAELGVLRAELRRRGIAVPPASAWWSNPPQQKYPDKKRRAA